MSRPSPIRLLALSLLVVPALSAEESTGLLSKVAENYRSLRSFEIAGALTAAVPESNLQVHFRAVDAFAGPSFVHEHSTVLKYGEAFSFKFTDITDERGKKPQGNPLFSVVMPSHWGNYGNIDGGVRRIRELLPDNVELQGAQVSCTVLEVNYRRQGWSPEELTVKYWIDAERLLVLKEEFFESQDRDPILCHWVYEVDSVKLNQPPPDWLVRASTTKSDHPRPDWVGRKAPDFNLRDMAGQQLSLSSLHGRTVVLAFWATWCAPCREEMPTLQKLADDYRSRGVEIWSVSDEKPAKVKDWMERNQRKLNAAVDPTHHVFDQYSVEGIPAIVVVGADGRIRSYYTGSQPEESLRSIIDSAINEGTNN